MARFYREARRLQALAPQSTEFSLVDSFELDPVSGTQREITIGDMYQLQRRPSNEVPAAGPGLGIDSRLPPGQANAAGSHAQARLFQARHVAQGRWQIAQVGKPRAEADGIH